MVAGRVGSDQSRSLRRAPPPRRRAVATSHMSVHTVVMCARIATGMVWAGDGGFCDPATAKEIPVAHDDPFCRSPPQSPDGLSGRDLVQSHGLRDGSARPNPQWWRSAVEDAHHRVSFHPPWLPTSVRRAIDQLYGMRMAFVGLGMQRLRVIPVEGVGWWWDDLSHHGQRKRLGRMRSRRPGPGAEYRNSRGASPHYPAQSGGRPQRPTDRLLISVLSRR